LTPEGVLVEAVSPDGLRLFATDGAIHAVAGGTPARLPAVRPDDRITCVTWSADGRSLYCYEDRYNDLPWPLYRFDIANGRRTLVRDLAPADRAGVRGLEAVRVTPDETVYFYSYKKALTDLYVAEGLR
jgi:hypothetical protein